MNEPLTSRKLLTDIVTLFNDKETDEFTNIREFMHWIKKATDFLNENQDDWIPVEKELPPYETRMLFWYHADRESAVIIGERSSYEKGMFWNGNIYLDFGRVSHWMSLPQPPEVTK